jgi:hypothetical protein
MLIVSALCSAAGLTGCATAVKTPKVIPDSRELIDLTKYGLPGYYGISAGYLNEIFKELGDREDTAK